MNHHASNNMNGVMMGRSRGGSSFDINDCFSKENHIEDLMSYGGSMTKTPAYG